MRTQLHNVIAAVAGAAIIAFAHPANAQPYGPGMMGGYGPGYGMMGGGYGPGYGPSMMGGYGPGYMMGPGYGGGYGPGMMGGGYGPGYGPSMMGGYGSGNMMGPGYGGGYGPGMMGGYGPGYYGNQGDLKLTTDQVKAYLGSTIRNPNLTVGDVKEKDADTIVADVVTKQGNALVQRLNFNRHNGFIQPEQ